MYRLKFWLIFITFLFVGSLVAAPVNTTWIGTKAIKGYDTVAYFKVGKSVRGNKKISYKWKGANWYFSSKANLELFKKNPKKYAPQFGGYCAYAVSKGHTSDISPDAWDIHNNKLYLNYDKDVQKTWRAKKKLYIKRAIKNWPKLSK